MTFAHLVYIHNEKWDPAGTSKLPYCDLTLFFIPITFMIQI